MLILDAPQTVLGYTVYGDDVDKSLFYVVPNQPNFRIGDDGLPVFSYVEYRQRSTDRASVAGALNGALCLFDVEFTVSKLDLDKVAAVLSKPGKPAQTTRPQYLWGRAELLLPTQEGMIHVNNAGKPSLVGSNVTSFNIQMKPDWAEIYKSGMMGKGGRIQVVYQLGTPARCGKMTVTIEYKVDQVKEFMEKITTNRKGSGSGYVQDLNENYNTDRLGTITTDFGFAGTADAATQAAREVTRASIRQWALDILSKQMEKELLELSGLSKEDRDKFAAAAAKDAEDNKVIVRSNCGWFWRYYYDQPQERQSQLTAKFAKSSRFKTVLSEDYVIDFNIAPQGTLPAITALFDKKGAKVKWEDFSTSLTLGNNFYERKFLQISVAHTFSGESPVTHVVIKAKYGTFKKERLFDAKQAAPWNIEVNQEKEDELTYSYTVHYRSGKPYSSKPIKTDGSNIILTAADLGIATLLVDATVLNIFRDDCTVAEVNVKYPGLFTKLYRFRLEGGKTPSPERPAERDEGKLDDDEDDTPSQPGALPELLKSLAEPIYTGEPKLMECVINYIFKDRSEWKETQNVAIGTTLSLEHPFSHERDVEVAADRIHRDVDRVEVYVEYKETGLAFSRKLTVTLTEEKKNKTVFFKAPGDGTGTFSACGRIYYKAGNSIPVPALTLEGKRFNVSQASDPAGDTGENQEMTVDVSFSENLWKTFSSINNFVMKYVDKENPRMSKTMKQPVKLTPATEDPFTWTVEVRPNGPQEVTWEGTFVYKKKGHKPPTKILKGVSPNFTVILDPPEEGK